jgi:hypothetical protein
MPAKCQQNASKMPEICQQNASNMPTKYQQNASKMPIKCQQNANNIGCTCLDSLGINTTKRNNPSIGNDIFVNYVNIQLG